ncbi:protein roadkill-like [Planococcus citri]|uniref:protein roadkill-like n=1 Tax=Planococcus citri TaxID=170843 RepID=UPI0031FA061C
MTCVMKIPYPKGARRGGVIEQSVTYPEGEKTDLITWHIYNIHDQLGTSMEGNFVSERFTVSDDDGITFTWSLAILKSYRDNRKCYYLYPCFISENDCKEAFVKIELIFRDGVSGKCQSTGVTEICRFDAKNQNSSVSLRIDAEKLSSPHRSYCYCKIIESNLIKFSLSKDLGNIFKNQNFTDIKLLSNDGKVFEAHRMILSARSSVFAAMFTHQKKENAQNEVNIDDMNGEVVEDLLKYIYTDKPEKLQLLAKELFVAADKYDLKRLKTMSEDVLIENLSISNAIEILHFSQLHNATRLKTEVVKFITTKTNAEVFETEAWESLEQTNLLKEICKAFAKR